MTRLMPPRKPEFHAAPSPPRRPPGLIALAAITFLTSGCLERRIRITSDPSGARVWLNDVDVGVTPTETEFTWHGVYDVRLDRDGYEPVHASRKAKAPIWEYPLIDAIAGSVPLTFSKVHEWHFDLEPSLDRRLPPAEAEAELIERAASLRAAAGIPAR